MHTCSFSSMHVKWYVWHKRGSETDGSAAQRWSWTAVRAARLAATHHIPSREQIRGRHLRRKSVQVSGGSIPAARYDDCMYIRLPPSGRYVRRDTSQTDPSASKTLMRICHEYGLRAFIGRCQMDRNSPDWYKEPDADTSCKHTRELISYSQELCGPLETASVQPILTPRFAICCTPELMHGIGAIAREYPACMSDRRWHTADLCSADPDAPEREYWRD